MSEVLEQRVLILERNLEILIGRLNGLHELAVAMLLEREGPTEDLVAHLKLIRERSTATLLQLPLGDATIKEHLRINAEMTAMAESVIQGRGKPRWQNGQPASE